MRLRLRSFIIFLHEAPFSPLTLPHILQAFADTVEAFFKVVNHSALLIGSAARQEMTDRSDIDLLVLLPSGVNHAQELSTLVDLTYPLDLEATYWISIKSAAQDKFEAGNTQLYRNIQKEEIRLL